MIFKERAICDNCKKCLSKFELKGKNPREFILCSECKLKLIQQNIYFKTAYDLFLEQQEVIKNV